MSIQAKFLYLCCAAATLSACSTIDYQNLKPGEFKGEVLVLWIDDGTNVGDGNFLFVPDPANPLRFVRPGSAKHATYIQPLMMYTDGGSIPKIAQAFNGFSPWGYAPAYMVHDWIFVVRHCIVDGRDDPKFATYRDMTFDESASILGEAIKTLVATGHVRKDDFAASSITWAVDTSIAKSLWDVKGSCTGRQLKPEHVALAEQAVPGSSKFANWPQSGAVPDAQIGPTPASRFSLTSAKIGLAAGPKAKVVARVSLGR